MGCGEERKEKETEVVVVRVKREVEGVEAGSPQEGIITYKRRRVANPSREASGHHVDMVAYKHNSEQDGHFRITNHWGSWRYTLENLLQSPHISEGGGIHSCIRDALSYDPSQPVRKLKRNYILSGSSKPQELDKGLFDAKNQSGVVDSVETNSSIASRTSSQATSMCNNVLLDILISEKFALLCDLLCRNFQENKSKTAIDFNQINAKMKNGDYAKSPGLFDHDIQQVWGKFEDVGREMVLLAKSLSSMSRSSYQKQADGASEAEAGEHKTEETYCVGVKCKNPRESTSTIQLTTCDSGHSTKPDQTEASGLYKICTCKHCGTEANGQGSLICDGCEAMYHFSCVEPAVQEIPTQSWYCSACSIKRMESAGDALNHVHHDSLHNNCAVCDRLDVSKPLELPESGSRTELADDAQESSVSSMGEDEKPDLSMTALSRLCKHCGTCEDDDKKFLICDHMYCPYKFYHIRCLKTSQIASVQQQSRPCWYCPSCLCRGCFVDKDDDQIVLCDGCDEAYHMYCMKPPRTSIPKGQWYCISCSIERAREGMRKYEQSILQKHSNIKNGGDAHGSRILLLGGPEK